VVCVADRGIGIAPEDLPRLFTRFGKIAQVARQGHVGTGLGLYISRQLVEAMGGEIWVNSTPGVGSTFCFRLPLAR
jgi:signal transduction histidine kinase